MCEWGENEEGEHLVMAKQNDRSVRGDSVRKTRDVRQKRKPSGMHVT